MRILAAATASQDTAPPGYSAGKAGSLARLARIGGQVRGVARMAGGDRYCTGVLTQISAITRALQEVALSLLDDHVRHCLPGAARSGPQPSARSSASWPARSAARCGSDQGGAR